MYYVMANIFLLYPPNKNRKKNSINSNTNGLLIFQGVCSAINSEQDMTYIRWNIIIK